MSLQMRMLLRIYFLTYPSLSVLGSDSSSDSYSHGFANETIVRQKKTQGYASACTWIPLGITRTAPQGAYQTARPAGRTRIRPGQSP